MLQVSFLGYFAGCVDHNNMPVVSGDSKEEDGGWRSLFRPGPEPVRARVLMIDYVNKVCCLIGCGVIPQVFLFPLAPTF